MARYKLIAEDDGEEHEVGGQRKTTKKEIESWVNDNIKACGLDWRVGFVVKFRTGKTIYTWRWIKNNEKVSI